MRQAPLYEVRYDGPGHRLLAFGQELARGAIGLFTEAELLSLQAQPHIRVTLLQQTPEPEADTGEGHDDTHQQQEE